MAAPARCNDWTRHQAKHLLGAPYTFHRSAALPACSALRSQCDSHSQPFNVCLDCEDHTQSLLHLEVGSPAVNHPNQIHAWNKNYGQNNDQRIGDTVATSMSPTPGPPILWPAVGFPPTVQAMAVPVIAQQIAPGAENPPWGGYLTRVCQDCERMIRSIQNLRSQHWELNAAGNAVLINAIIPALPIETRSWEDVPFKSCTCRYNLGMPPLRVGLAPAAQPMLRMCYTHRGRTLRRLEAKKDTNDQWLRNVALNRSGTGSLVSADSFTVPNPHAGAPGQPNRYTLKDLRRANGNWRACRCGKELDVPFDLVAASLAVTPSPEAYICMACEGWWSTTPNQMSRYDTLNPGNPGALGPRFHTKDEVEQFRLRQSRVRLGRRVV